MPENHDVSASFVAQYESEVFVAYQMKGSKLRSTVRNKSNVKGESTTFQKVGKGIAGSKARHGNVPVMNIDHTPVKCTLVDRYAGDYVDKLDELKINHDEKQVIVDAGAYALGRETDAQIIDQLAKTTNIVGDGTTALTKALILKAFAKLNSKDVPDDGQRFGIVSPQQWNELLQIEEFSKSNYVGDALPFLKGTEAKKWLGITWIMHTGLPLKNNIRTNFIYHKTAAAHASGQDITSDITWQGEKAAHFINNMMSMGACLIDSDGVVALKCLDDSESTSSDSGSSGTGTPGGDGGNS